MIFFTSDLHINHDRDFIWGARGYEDVIEHNEDIVKIWNEIVSDEDEVYVLGDICLGGGPQKQEDNFKILSQLKGKIHFIIGNHDTPVKIKLYDKLNFINEGYANVLRYRKYNFYISHYPTLTGNYDDKNLKTKTINLCGHTHTTDKFADMGKCGISYHVDWDAHKCPVSIDTIIKDLKEFMGE